MKVFFLLLLLISGNLQAHMSSEFSTFWGGMRRAFYFSHNQRKPLQIQPPGFSAPITVYMRELDKPAPLLVYYTGIFCQISSKIMPFMIDHLEKLNAHIIILPSFLADEFLIAKPPVKAENLWESESELQQNLFDFLSDKIGREKITENYIYSESLGVWQAMMLTSVKKTKFKKMLITWPALDLNESLKLFDKKIADMEPIYNRCSYWWRWPLAFIRYYREEPWKNLTKEDEECLGAYGIQVGFLKRLRKVSQNVSEQKKFELKQEPGNFTEFVKFVVPELYPMVKEHNDQLIVKHWLPGIEAQGIDTYFISSDDDFINTKSMWDEFQTFPYLKNKIQLQNWGGHSGPLSSEVFWKQFNAIFSELQ